MPNWYNYSWNDAVEKLGSDSYMGLSSSDIEKMKDKYGENKILCDRNKRNVITLIKEFKQYWILVSFFILIILFFFKEWVSFLIFTTAVFLSIIFIFMENCVEKKSLRGLKKLNSYFTTVIRDGVIKNIPTEEVVVGDIVLIKVGNIVPADLRIIESHGLKVKETSVTGSNYVSEKYEAKIEEHDITLPEMKNIAFKSTSPICGDGVGIAVSVGMNTEVGNIIRILSDSKQESNLLEDKLNKILSVSLLIFVVYSIAFSAFGIQMKFEVNKILIGIAKIFLISVPFEIVLIVYILLYVLKSLERKKGIKIKNYSCIEKLGKVNAIFLDKVGLLSENMAQVKKIYTYGQNFDVPEDNKIDINENIQKLIDIALLCNDAKYDSNTDSFKGDMKQAAIIKFATQNSIDDKKLFKRRRIFEILYDPVRELMTTVNKIDKKYRANVSGSVDKLVEKCKFILKNGVEEEITQEDIEAIKNCDIQMSNALLQGIGFAYRNFNYEPSPNENIESYLVFAGIIGFLNPLKDDARSSIKDLSNLDIKPIVITEDSKLTSLSLNKSIGIEDSENMVLCGVELDNMDDDELKRNIEKVSTFSKINSEQKLRTVKIIENNGYSAAVLGSKLTDLPSMESGDISIAVGDKCSNAIKQLASVFFEDIDMKSLVSLFIDSPKIDNALQKILMYISTCCVGFIVYSLLSLMYFHTIVLSPLQILIISVMDTIFSSYILFMGFKYDKKVQNDNNYVNIFLPPVVIGFISFTVTVFDAKFGFIVLYVLFSLYVFRFIEKKLHMIINPNFIVYIFQFLLLGLIFKLV